MRTADGGLADWLLHGVWWDSFFVWSLWDSRRVVMGRDLGSGAILFDASTRHAVILPTWDRLEVCPASVIESKLTNRSDTIADSVTSTSPTCDDPQHQQHCNSLGPGWVSRGPPPKPDVAIFHAPIFVSSFSHRAIRTPLVLSRLPAQTQPPLSITASSTGHDTCWAGERCARWPTCPAAPRAAAKTQNCTSNER